MEVLVICFFVEGWLERNNRIFKNNSRTVEDIVEKIIVRTVSEWGDYDRCVSRDFFG